ncbi:hypothetical protein J2W55_003996 [Mucilaginibacter pocheonensis]|uniref:Uncharacterized protein n=1 Tax=Mucilaginibacter pocheonensis TaxID=398050 RepID=A0ABU1TFG4_9SPHI|nr:hypothetical protein [Mucilaginibacter pocheonensis]
MEKTRMVLLIFFAAINAFVHERFVNPTAVRKNKPSEIFQDLDTKRKHRRFIPGLHLTG